MVKLKSTVIARKKAMKETHLTFPPSKFVENQLKMTLRGEK